MRKLILLSFLISTTWAQTDARKIMESIEQKNDGLIGASSEMTMTLIDAHGKSVERKLNSITKEGAKGEDKSIAEFTLPLDVKGTKLLTWTRPNEDNQVWLYLPKFKRVKKINSSGQSGSFMGSEFSYEDISGMQLDKYQYKLLSEDEKTWTIEATPIHKSGYSKIVSTYSKEYYVPTKSLYYDRKGELLKTSQAENFKELSNQGKTFYFPEKITMNNEQTRKSSIIQWTQRKIGIKHSDSLFQSEKLTK